MFLLKYTRPCIKKTQQLDSSCSTDFWSYSSFQCIKCFKLVSTDWSCPLKIPAPVTVTLCWKMWGLPWKSSLLFNLYIPVSTYSASPDVQVVSYIGVDVLITELFSTQALYQSRRWHFWIMLISDFLLPQQSCKQQTVFISDAGITLVFNTEPPDGLMAFSTGF